jgi:hypothetical protein
LKNCFVQSAGKWQLFFCCVGVEQVGSVRHVEMLHRTNLLAIVGGGPSARYADNTGFCIPLPFYILF